MTVRPRVAGSVAGLLFLLAAARLSFAADQEAILQQITSLNKAAIAAYSDGDFDKSKAQLLQAVALGKKDPEIQAHPLMARTFLHLGVLYVDGYEDREGGVRYFVKALKLRPDIAVTQALATKTVKSAFEEARGQAGEAGSTAPATAVAAKEPGKEPAKDSAKEPKAAEAAPAAETETPAPKMTATEKRKAAEEAKRTAAEEKRAAAEEKKKAAQEAKEAAAEEKRMAADEKKKAAEDKKKAAEEEKKAAADEKKAQKELALVKDNEAKERAAKEKLQTEKADKEKQLADTKAALEKLQKEAKEAEKQAQAAQDKLSKELAAVKDSEGKERAAKEKLQSEKAAQDKQLADAKGTIQQLQKEKADKDKQLADASGREKKEREAKEKLEKEKLVAEAREKERKAQEDKQRQEREKLAAGPAMPSHIPEPLFCAVPDEAQAGSDLFVHCAPRSDVKAKVVALYYRQSGGVHYNSLAMEPGKKGWYMAVIPADKVNGKVLQYYAEARDGHDKLAAATGKASSPNILTLRSGGTGGAKATATTAGRTPARAR